MTQRKASSVRMGSILLKQQAARNVHAQRNKACPSSLSVGVGLCSILLWKLWLVGDWPFWNAILYLCGGRALWQGPRFVVLIDFVIIIIASLRVVLVS